MEVSVCFSLGQSLRNGDVEVFLEQYDTLLGGLDHQSARLQLATAKEFARQISELSKEDFTLIQSTCALPAGDHTPILTDEPVTVQLTTLLDHLRQDDDSGAISDMDSCLENTELYSDGSTCQLTEEGGDNLQDEGQTVTTRDSVETLSDNVSDGVMVQLESLTQQTIAESTLSPVDSDNKPIPTQQSVNPSDGQSISNDFIPKTAQSKDNIPVISECSIHGNRGEESKSKIKRKVRPRRTTSNAAETPDRRQYTCPADQYNRQVTYEHRPHDSYKRSSRRGRKTGLNDRYSNQDFRKCKGGVWQNSSRQKRSTPPETTPPGLTARGDMWRDFPLPTVTYNHKEVVNYLWRGWQKVSRELKSHS